MNFETDTVSPLDLILDKNNPRFIVPSNPNEEDIIKYLLQYEEIIDLIKGINVNKGLLVGERIIVFKENSKYVVAEGNRRTCACKLILNSKLIPESFRSNFPKISDETIKNICKINVDIVKNRLDALNAMGTKHISGIKEWASYSKMQFFALQFQRGKSINNLALLTSVSKDKIKDYIKSFNLISYAKSLDIWSEEEKNSLFNFHKDKATIFPRALRIKSNRLNESLSKILEITFAENNFYPSSNVQEELFNYCIYKVVSYSYDEKYKFNTRTPIDKISEMIDVLEGYINTGKVSDKIPLIKSSYVYKEDKPENKPEDKLEDKPENKPEDKLEDKPENKPEDNPGVKRSKVKGKKRPKSPNFFSNLTWSKVDVNNPEYSGLIYLCNEICKISKSRDYEKYPIASAILARALFEQTLIYYLKKVNKYDKFAKGFNGKVPPLEKTIDHYKKNLKNIFNNEVNIIRSFSIFTESGANKDYFDMVIHNPQLIKANSYNLDMLAESGLKGFINSVLNL